jgi:phospholipid/cholesterol/gamma-HCH transport system ATP-binding protein
MTRGGKIAHPRKPIALTATADGRVIAEGPIATMLESDHPWLKAYFRGKRARMVLAEPSA